MPNRAKMLDKLVFVISIFLALFSEAKSQAGSKYYYSVAQVGSDSDEWGYQVPECKALPMQKYRQWKCTQENGKQSEVCVTSYTAKLQSVVSKETQTFPIAWIVFESLSQCRRSRERYLSGEEN